VRDLAIAQGADVSEYRGWANVSLGGPDDHPGSLCARALKAALADAGLPASELRLVVSAGISRDFPPSWSIAAEVMRLTGVPEDGVGFDLTLGCLGTLTALNTVLGWLGPDGGGYAAVVAAERWSDSINRGDAADRALWAHGDGGGAIVVGIDGGGKGRFMGAVFTSYNALNGHVLVKYGGTRFPVAPADVDPRRRELGPTAGKEVSKLYQAGYSRVFEQLRTRFDVVPERLICNQISPGITARIGDIAEVPPERRVVTGHDVGHLGSADVILGLRRLLDAGDLDSPVAMASSVSHAYGAGLLLPAA
jgi:3-oxoacyl-[acyl-carrier-protein] synthase III